ncbi:MAG: DedA family protein [Hyphomicrobiales bacterium]|nr:DedA family protein [Hyphomicrobiales bacterium]
MAKRHRWTTRRWAAAAALLVSLASIWHFGARTFHSYDLLRSASAVGLPAVANIRPWMTLAYVATTYDAPLPELTTKLSLTTDTPGDTPLGAIAEGRGVSPIAFVEEVQAAVAAVVPGNVQPEEQPTEMEEDPSDDYLSALLAYRYPALALVLLVGAIGLPVPTGFSTLLAGSLVAIGEMDWVTVAAIAVGASLAGDVIGYAIGRLADEKFLDRIGGWIGYSGHRKIRIRRLFTDWGGLTIVLTRTLVSHLSSLASLLAGISHYPFAAFLGFASVGRLIWTAAYLGLGYIIGNNIDAAGTFLEHVTGLVLSLGAVVALGSYLLMPSQDAAAPSTGA